MGAEEPLRAAPAPSSWGMLLYRPLRGTASSDHLDMVRGAAAIAVLLGHLRTLFLVDFSEVARPSNPLVKLVYFVSGFGHFAVMVFFVLSGFLVGGSVLRGRMHQEFNWSGYAINRLTRLWIVLIPALVLGAIWDHAGIRMFGTAGIYGRIPGSIGRVFAVQPRLSSSIMLGNALFLQGISTITFGSNGPLWSLSYEFWYYVLFPLIILAYPLKKVSGSTVLYATASLIVICFIGQTISLYFLIWLLGAAINLAPERSGARGKLWVLMATGAVVVAVAVLKFTPRDNEYPDFFVGVASAALIFALLRIQGSSRSGFYSRTVRRLAGFSYTLYLVHVPALEFMSAWLVPGRRWQPDAVHIAILAGLGLCALGYAFALARLTEDRTDEVRSTAIAILGSRLGLRPST
jgi:peptidoglycan/LPS O-acetylase OafA/YrhL